MTLFYLTLAWLAGLGIAYQSDTVWWAWLIVSGVGTVGVLLARRRPGLQQLFGCIVIVGIGAARLDLATPTFGESDLASFNGRPVARIEGIIDDAPVTHNATATLKVRAQKLIMEGGEVKPVDGLVLVTAISSKELEYGDQVSLEGDLQTPPTGAQFSYRDYLARAGIFSLMPFARVRVIAHNQGSPVQAALFQWRDFAAARIKQLMPDPEASLLQGILLGSDDGISSDIKAAFNAISATHIIAISGANMVVVAGFLQAVTGRLTRQPWITVVTLAGVIVYTIFVGANPAVVRAAIMTSLALIAARLGRQTYGPASLGFAVLVMTAINPFVLWDVGFQLSFLATAGLIFYVEPIQGWLGKILTRLVSAKAAGVFLGAFSDALVVTLAAQFVTTPIIVLYFERLPVLALPVNFLIIPAQPPIMIMGGLGVLASILFWPLGQVLAWISWLFLAFTVVVVKLFAALPLASIDANVSPGLVAAFYFALLAATITGQQAPEQRQNWWNALRKNISLKVMASVGVVAVLLLIISGLSLPDGKLHMTALDVGDGSAVLIQTPSGRHILVDAGGDGRTLSTAVGERMPFWERRIDVIIITQPTQASSSGLGTLLERYQVPVLVTNGGQAGPILGSVQDGLRQQGTQIETATTGMVIQVGDGVTLTVLNNPGSGTAANSPGEPVSLLIRYGAIGIVLPGNIAGSGQNAVLKAHESAGSPIMFISSPNNDLLVDADFLEQMSPQMVIVADNSNAPIDAGVLAEMEKGGRTVYTISRSGSIELTSDGTRLWMLTDR